MGHLLRLSLCISTADHHQSLGSFAPAQEGCDATFGCLVKCKHSWASIDVPMPWHYQMKHINFVGQACQANHCVLLCYYAVCRSRSRLEKTTVSDTDTLKISQPKYLCLIAESHCEEQPSKLLTGQSKVSSKIHHYPRLRCLGKNHLT